MRVTYLDRVLSRIGFLLVCIWVWYQYVTPFQIGVSMLTSVLFACIETIYLTLMHEDETGWFHLRGWQGKWGHSSFAQYWANVLYTPILIDYTRNVLLADVSPLIRVLIMPLNVWLLEIIEGYAIMFVFNGKNVAWEYKGWDTLFHGNIKGQYILNWWGLGIAVEVAYDLLLRPVCYAIHPYLIPYLVVAVLATLRFSGDMGLSNLIVVWNGLSRSEKRIFRGAFIVLCVTQWKSHVSDLQIGLALVGASFFAVIETTFTTLRSEDVKTGKVTWGWRGQVGHSSFAQFWANILYLPVLLDVYRNVLLPHVPPILRVLLFPLNIWILEIIEGYSLIFIFDRNVAWEYSGWDSVFHGNVKLTYFFFWMGLGFAVEYSYDSVVVPLALTIGPYYIPVLASIAYITMFVSTDMSLKKLI